MKYKNLIVFYLLLIFLLIYFINNKCENMFTTNNNFNKILYENGYSMKNNIIYKDGKIIKSYKGRTFNDPKIRYNTKNKIKTNNILSNNNIPVPRNVIINKYNKDKYLNNDVKIEFPVVLKQTEGSQGLDVYPYVTNRIQFNNILSKLLSKYDNVLLEELIEGNSYRVIVFNNKVVDVIQEIEPYIIGDGERTVKELIDIRNLNRQKPTTCIDTVLIKEQGYELDDIVNNGDKLIITKIINSTNGTDLKRIDIDSIPIENINLFIEATKSLNLELSGIDFIIKDITVPYTINGGAIIEVNRNPDKYIHEVVNVNDKYFIYRNMVNSLN